MRRRANVYVAIRYQGKEFRALLDTGCDISVMSSRILSDVAHQDSGQQMLVANRSPVPILGTATVAFIIGKLQVDHSALIYLRRTPEVMGQAARWLEFIEEYVQPTNSIRRRQWCDFNYDKFCADLSSSSLLFDTPRDAAGLFTCYHDTLQALVDKHAPFAVHKLRAHPTAPWYDLNCHLVKTEARRLERIYRRDKSDRNRQFWRRQSRILRSTLHEK